METNASVKPVAALVPTAAQSESDLVFQSTAKESSDVEENGRYRLLIEEGPAKGVFVYKTLDSVTGEVVRQFPREQVLRLAESQKYDKGSVIKTSA